MVNVSEGICFRLANVVSLHQLNEERRVMSEEFNTRGARHSKFRVADNFSINNLKERKRLWNLKN